jgi:hypothetical protein
VGDGGLGELSFNGSEGLTSKEKSGQGPPEAHGKKLMFVHKIKINPYTIGRYFEICDS